MSFHRTIQAICFIALLISSKNCFAPPVTTSFNVSATVLDGCTVGATDMAFGIYDNENALRTTNTISVTCNNETPYNILLNSGLHPGGNGFTRNLANGENLLPYNIYQKPTYTTIWGDGTGGSSGMNGLVANGALQEYTAYGQIPPIENAPAVGQYADQITVTVTTN